ncbi:unnamed protein product [Toxocara canis]|uniref:Lipase_3 domain-containing protein n=1 Tax=Toxocara canis TaxID=6265 RepID=A0A183US62_TOXCA|nr:unnamed protein product [Toxocara canis]
MRSIAVLLALIQTLVNASCNPKGSCLSCVSAGCRWCVNTNRCVTKFAAPFKCFGEERADEWLKCPISMKQGYRYSDEFARTKMHPLSVAAYSDNPQSCLNNILKGAEVKFKITGQCHGRKPENCSGFAAISNTEKAIILSFRGSKGISQLTSQAIETAFGKSFVDLDGAGRVNSYFYRTFIYIWNAGMKESLRSMLQEHPDYEIWVTGHSLGGAMASIASTVIIRDRMHTTDKLKLVTFGQPRTGDRNYAVAHNSMVCA